MSKIIQVQDGRRNFIDRLTELAETDSRILFIVPDVGFNYASKFSDKFPDRFINTGVTEEATMIIAAGLALQGMKPWVYSMINFSVFRPFEMIRNAIVLHNSDVKILGVSGSEKYKMLGFSHSLVFENEDEYHLSPYMRCFFPKEDEVKNVVDTAYSLQRPCYIRL